MCYVVLVLLTLLYVGGIMLLLEKVLNVVRCHMET